MDGTDDFSDVFSLSLDVAAALAHFTPASPVAPKDESLLRTSSGTATALGQEAGDRVEDIKLTLFSDASFAGDLQDSKSTSGGFLALVGPHTFFPLGGFRTNVP